METKNRITIGYAFLFLAYAGYYRNNTFISLLGIVLSIGILAIRYKARKPKINSYILLGFDMILLGLGVIGIFEFVVLLANIICLYLILPYLKDKECRLVSCCLVVLLIGLSTYFYIVNNALGFDNAYYFQASGMLFMLWIPLLLGIVDNRIVREISVKSEFAQR